MAGPRLFDAKEIERIEEMAGVGMTVEQMAHVVGVSKATFERRQNDQPEVHEAVSKGRSIAARAVMKTAYEMAVSGECPTMTIFWLKTRQGWKEPKEPDPNDLFKDKSIGELIELVRALLPKEETPK